MEPTIPTKGKIAFVWKLADYKKGDVVISLCPVDPNKNICKRIAAAPGELVYYGNKVYRDLIMIPPGQVWLLGDNPQNSHDSRNYGPVPMGLLKGKLLFTMDTEFPFFHPLAPLVSDEEKDRRMNEQIKAIEEEKERLVRLEEEKAERRAVEATKNLSEVIPSKGKLPAPDKAEEQSQEERLPPSDEPPADQPTAAETTDKREATAESREP